LNCFLIQPMGFNDLEQILEIESCSFFSPWTRTLFEEDLTNPHSRIFLLKHREEGRDAIIGYICLWLVSDEAHILKIAVRPAARRKGFASALLQFALDYSYQRSMVKAFLEVREHNQPARCFYGKFGFSLLGVRPGYYQDTKENALILQLDLETFVKNHDPMKKTLPEIPAP